MPVVAGYARNRGAQLPALLCEGGSGASAVHGAERTDEDAGDDLPKVGEMGEVTVGAITVLLRSHTSVSKHMRYYV